MNPRLLDLLERGELDWDDPRHREAYLRAWVNAPRKQEEESLDRRPAGNRPVPWQAPETFGT